MHIVVASRNPVKVDATRRAFNELFPEVSLEVGSVEVESGVSDQPVSDEETRRGARTRAMNASQAEPDADFWVGMEGGIEVIDNQLMALERLPTNPDYRAYAVREFALPGRKMCHLNRSGVFSTSHFKQVPL